MGVIATRRKSAGALPALVLAACACGLPWLALAQGPAALEYKVKTGSLVSGLFAFYRP